MPLGRYFLLMGGALLMVLLVAGAYLPSPPVVEQVETRQPKIRIHSDKKLPERVVFDTSMVFAELKGAEAASGAAEHSVSAKGSLTLT